MIPWLAPVLADDLERLVRDRLRTREHIVQDTRLGEGRGDPLLAECRDRVRRFPGLRRDGYRAVVEHLEARFGLRAGLDTAAATDLLLTFGGSALYRSLVLDYGWPHERYVSWLAQTLTDQLVRSPATRR